MDPSTNPDSSVDSLSQQRAKGAENRLATLSSLLNTLEDHAQPDALSTRTVEDGHGLRLVEARLGIASSLFVALRSKHPPTASHSLRVALAVSSWATAAELSEEQCDVVEVAALLHDIGKIGVPDRVLLKPGRLSGEELLLMERHRQLGSEIISGCCSSQAVLDTVFFTPAWYDGSKHGFEKSGRDLPAGARMIAIVDAFDAMTTDHIYRRAVSRERALAELFEHSGTQFDPNLVKQFTSLASKGQIEFTSRVSRRWLQQIEESDSNSYWSLERPVAPTKGPPALPFHQRLLDSMHDGVFFVDDGLVVTEWNRAVERMTGIASDGIAGRRWTPGLIQMRDERGNSIADEACFVNQSIQSGAQALRRVTVLGRNNDRISIDLHVAPVLRADGVPCGATVVLHDASSQITLEKRVQTLHEKATTDPLTNVSNRAEFNRVLPLFVERHLEAGVPGSMIICDIDHFKRINDGFGHQAGDEALVLFGGLLKRHARVGDVVARYGGEEFVILCADCDNATATKRAEDLRRHVSEHEQPSLGNNPITASFGVTAIQAGDTAESFLNRADRALLQAKDNGRNLVVQLGTGICKEVNESRTSGWLNWFHSSPAKELLSRNLITVVPLNVAAEKLRGFVADHDAQILDINENRVTLKIDGADTPMTRRRSDRPVPFLIELTFEEQIENDPQPRDVKSGTIIQVVVRPKRHRDRRRDDVSERARQILVSLKSYLMAHDYTNAESSPTKQEGRENFLLRSKQVLSYWLTK